MGATPEKSAYIVTGTTRGIGLALAQGVVDRGHLLYTISRAPEHRAPGHQNYSCDLRDLAQVQAVMNRVMQDVPYSSCSDLVLINNAGMLAPIGFLENIAAAQMEAHLHVNVMAPMLLMSLFIQLSNQSADHLSDHLADHLADTLSCRRRILNITSGAASTPYAGWSVYCAGKAALNMITRCAALEQSEGPGGVSISAIAPGVVDTDMQAQIRASNAADFPARARFVRMRAEGHMPTSAQVAALILDLDADGQFRNGGIYDLRDAVDCDGKTCIEKRQQGSSIT
jgi:benzil reductase ((S)-benzoin forming)